MFQLMPNFITGSGKYKNNSISKLTNYNSIFLSKESLNSLLSKTYFSIFYDYGYVRNKYNDDLQKEYNSRSGIMSGFGIGLNYYGDYLNWSLVYSKAINSPNYLEFRDGIKKENHSVYWKFGINW